MDAGSAFSSSRPLRKVRVAYLVSHPIQYQAPMLRYLASLPEIDLTVFFGSDFSVKSYRDKGFGVDVKWDTPLLEGYKYVFLPALRDNGTASVLSPISCGMSAVFAGFDVLWVHGYGTLNQLRGMLAAKASGIPILLRAESWLSDRPRSRVKLLAKRVFFAGLRQIVDGVLAIGSHNRDYWEHYFGAEFPIFLMPYAVDNAYFQRKSGEAATLREALREELGLEAGRPVILFASKLQKRKHCGDLVEAFARLAGAPSSSLRPYLLIVGDGEERLALEARVEALGLEGVRFCGFRNQSELPRFFDLCSVFVLPSRHEPWGLIVNEAMNAARAVIVSNDVGCQVDLITDGIEGCVFPVRDVDALADCLRRVLGPGTAEAMGLRARDRIARWSFEEDGRGFLEAVAHVTRLLPGQGAMTA